jgi:hypothetical protein
LPILQLKLDFESYNDNNIFHEAIEPLDFDFNKDIEELNMPTTYSDDTDVEQELNGQNDDLGDNPEENDEHS